MLGRQIKSGVRLQAEKVVIENTDDSGYINVGAVRSVRNQQTIKRVLKDWGYEPVYSSTNNVKAYKTVNSKELPNKNKDNQKIENFLHTKLARKGRVLFSNVYLLRKNKKKSFKVSEEFKESWRKLGKRVMPVYKPLNDGRQKIIGYKLEPLAEKWG